METKPLDIKVTIVEPGYFRTNFLDDRSLTATSTEAKNAFVAAEIEEWRELPVSTYFPR